MAIQYKNMYMLTSKPKCACVSAGKNMQILYAIKVKFFST